MPGIADLDYPQPRLVSITGPVFVHSGTVDAAPVANKLVDAEGGFDLANQFRHGAIVWNTSTDAVAYLIAVDDATTLSLSDDIFLVGSEDYQIWMPANTQDRPEGYPTNMSSVVVLGTAAAPGDTNYLTGVTDYGFDHFVAPGDKVVNITDEEVLTVLDVIDGTNLLMDGPIVAAKKFRIIRENEEYPITFFSAEGTSIVGLAVDSKTVVFTALGGTEGVNAYTLNCIPTGLTNGEVVNVFTEILSNANAQSGSNPLYAVSSGELSGLQVVSGDYTVA